METICENYLVLIIITDQTKLVVLQRNSILMCCTVQCFEEEANTKSTIFQNEIPGDTSC